jgi:hypothetical protein
LARQAEGGLPGSSLEVKSTQIKLVNDSSSAPYVIKWRDIRTGQSANEMKTGPALSKHLPLPLCKLFRDQAGLQVLLQLEVKAESIEASFRLPVLHIVSFQFGFFSSLAGS